MRASMGDWAARHARWIKEEEDAWQGRRVWNANLDADVCSRGDRSSVGLARLSTRGRNATTNGRRRHLGHFPLPQILPGGTHDTAAGKNGNG